MKLGNPHSVFFVGIGGIGMSALARYYKSLGLEVGGYDRVATGLTKSLEEEGMDINYVDAVESIPRFVLESPLEKVLVVYTPAIPASNIILGYLRSRGFKVQKRSEVLSSIIENQKTIAIAGTHGKTTTSSMVAHILNYAGIPCNAFLGGIASNFNSNLLLNQDAEYAVVEADEYDRSFLRLNPFIAVITSTDADHLDIYSDAANMESAFAEFAAKVHPEGVIFARQGLSFQVGASVENYGLEEGLGELYARGLEIVSGSYRFEVVYRKEFLGSVIMNYPGHHNVENALAAIGVALRLGIDWNTITAGLEQFKGVKRRFEYHIKNPNLVFIDDYAHHPTEIAACVGSVKELYPDKRITGVFQPHLYTRTRDFSDGFAESLSQLNELLLMEIYPAREEPIPGVDSNWLLDKIRLVNKKLVQREELIEEVLRLDPEVLLTMGAGDIDKLIGPLKDALDE